MSGITQLLFGAAHRLLDDLLVDLFLRDRLLGEHVHAIRFDFDEAAVNKNLRKEPRLRELLNGLAGKLEHVEPFNVETSEAALREFSEEAGVKAGLLINGARTMLTGQAVGPSMFEIFDLLGRDRSVLRLRSGVPW